MCCLGSVGHWGRLGKNLERDKTAAVYARSRLLNICPSALPEGACRRLFSFFFMAVLYLSTTVVLRDAPTDHDFCVPKSQGCADVEEHGWWTEEPHGHRVLVSLTAFCVAVVAAYRNIQAVLSRLLLLLFAP